MLVDLRRRSVQRRHRMPQRNHRRHRGALASLRMQKQRPAECLDSLAHTGQPEAAAGGTIAFVNEGDSITIDAHKLLLELNVPEAEIAKRRAAWTAPAPRYTRGVQAKFAFNASSASKGAVLDNY